MVEVGTEVGRRRWGGDQRRGGGTHATLHPEGEARRRACSAATTHADPTYVVDDVVHYCVANMPGAVGRTSTFALTNATSRYVQNLARKGLKQALSDDPGFLKGLNTYRSQIVYQPVAEAFDAEWVEAGQALGI